MTLSEPEGHWLVRNEQVLATLEIATTRGARRRGLLGRSGIEGALLLRPARSVHTFGMQFAIDVAHLDGEGRVLRLATMAPNRLGAFVIRSKSVVETEAGTFALWGVLQGDVLDIR